MKPSGILATLVLRPFALVPVARIIYKYDYTYLYMYIHMFILYT